MRKLTPLSLLALAGFTIGIFSGSHLSATSGYSAEPTGGHSQSGSPGRSATRQRVAAAPQEKHDLPSLLRWHFQQTDGDPEIRDEIGRMDSTAIRGLMIQLQAAYQIQPDEILNAAAKELYHREGEKALTWADSLDSDSGRQTILEQIITAAVANSPATAKSWIERYEGEFGTDIFSPFPSAARTGATRRGAADLLQLNEILGENQSVEPMGRLPDDFDFHLLISQSTNLAPLGAAMEYWTAKDRESAWAGVREIMNKDANKGVNFFGSVFTGIAATEGEQMAARWISQKLDDLPPDLRERAISTLLTNQLTQNTGYESVMAEFPRDADRVALAASIINPFANPTAGSNVLQMLGSESLQVQALVRSAKTFSRVASDPEDRSAKDIHSYFGKTMDQLKLGPDAREKINSILHTPQDPYPE